MANCTAVILAGGNGLRMRPLTCSLPKIMFSVCGEPLAEYHMSALKRNGITECIIAADRFSNVIASHFDDGRKELPKLSLSSVPEGTSTALSKAVKEWDIPDHENILVINGAALCDFDFEEIIRRHKYSGSLLTLILSPTERPYDCITASEENGVLKGILSYQPRESCVSELAVTGCFVINAGLAARLSEYGEDIILHALPALMKSGIRIDTVTEKGYFKQLITPNDLLEINADVLNGVYPYLPKCLRETGAEFFAGSGCDIDESAAIDGGAVLGENVTVGKNAKIHGGFIGSGSYIGRSCTVNQAVIGRSVRLSEGASVFEGAVIGENAVIEENASVSPHVKIWNGRHVEPFSCVSNDIKYGFAKPVSLNEEGITGETNGIINPQTAAMAGSAAASVGNRILVGCSGTKAAKALALAFCSGVMAAGKEVWFLDEVTEPELCYCIRISGGGAGCFIEAGISAKLRFFSSDGLPLTRREERLVENGINRGEFRRSGFMRFGNILECFEIRELYRSRLQKLLPRKLSGIRAVVKSPCSRITDTCEEMLKAINDNSGDPIIFHISGSGTKISAFTEETGYVFYEKLVLICCKERFAKGLDAVLPSDFPTAAEHLAEKYGRKILRYSICSDNSDKEARKAAAENSFVRDGAALMLELLGIISATGKTLKELCAELPEFASVNRFISLKGRGRQISLLRELCSEQQASSDGIVINDKRGRVMIRPVKTGQGVMMHVESCSIEAASELCDFYQDALNILSKRKNM